MRCKDQGLIRVQMREVHKDCTVCISYVRFGPARSFLLCEIQGVR